MATKDPAYTSKLVLVGDGTNPDLGIFLQGKVNGEWQPEQKILGVSGQNISLLGARLDYTDNPWGLDSTDGTLFKAGTSSARFTTDVASTNFMQLYTESTATSGDARSIYNRLYISGAGGGGESLRSFTTVNDVAGATARGAHISLSFASTGSLTGLGLATGSTIHVPNAAMSGGTYGSVGAEIFADGASSSISGVTEYSLFRAALSGNATGIGNIDDNAFLISLTGGANGAGNIVSAVGNEPTWASKTHLVRCKFNGTTMYVVAIIP